MITAFLHVSIIFLFLFQSLLHDPIDVPLSLLAIICFCKSKSNLVPNKGGLPRFLPSKLFTVTVFPGSTDFHFSKRVTS